MYSRSFNKIFVENIKQYEIAANHKITKFRSIVFFFLFLFQQTDKPRSYKM